MMSKSLVSLDVNGLVTSDKISFSPSQEAETKAMRLTRNTQDQTA